MEHSDQKLHHYTMCGLDNVYLRNGFAFHETAYGRGVSIQNLDGLHLAIAEVIVSRPIENCMAGKEFRFLRTFMNLSQNSFGLIYGVGEQAVAKWEKKGSDAVPQWASNFMRALFREYNTGKAGLMESLNEISRLEREIDQRHREVDYVKNTVENSGFRLDFDTSRDKWRAIAADQAA